MDTPDDIEHLVYEALAQLGWNTDAQRLASKVARLNIGLPREDEFTVVCSWLGKCLLIHKLDQRQAPANSSSRFQVPDLFAIFQVAGREVPVLIEVKSCQDRVLSFKAAYYERLQNYAAALKLPLLVAWKQPKYGIWTLFDASHMKLARTNFNISFNDAVCEGLLGVLGGDFSYSLAPGAGLHFRMRKEKLLSETETHDGSEQSWLAVFEGITCTDGKGRERQNLPDGVQTLLLAHDLELLEGDTPTHFTQHFSVKDDQSKFAHMALVRLLNWQAPTGNRIDWRAIVANPQPLTGIDNFTATVEAALHEGIVKYIFHIKPRTWPAFLPSSS